MRWQAGGCKIHGSAPMAFISKAPRCPVSNHWRLCASRCFRSRSAMGSLPTLSRHARSAFGADQLRPDAVPVIGAEVPAANLASSCPLNRDGSRRRNGSLSSSPCTQQRSVNGGGNSQRRLGTAPLIEVAFQIHPGSLAPR